jgi:hypothetical protein
MNRKGANSMSIAETIKTLLQSNPFMAVTLEYGYALDYENKKYSFKTGHAELIMRNPDGRCTKLVCLYPDQSRLVFTYHPIHGVKYKVK